MKASNVSAPDAPPSGLQPIYQPGQQQAETPISQQQDDTAAFQALIRAHLKKFGIENQQANERIFNSVREVIEENIRRQHEDRASKQFDFSGVVEQLSTQDPEALVKMALKLSDANAGQFLALPQQDEVTVSYDGTLGIITISGTAQAVQAFVNAIYFHANVNHLKHF